MITPTLFMFEKKKVRVVSDNVTGEALFVGKDVCDCLDYVRSSDAIQQHCKGAAIHRPLQTAGGIQNMRVLTEADVMRLIIGSTLPAAQAFERLVFEEILPSIRKTGSYTAPGAAVRPSGTDPALSAFRQSRAIASSAKVAESICAMFPALGAASKQTIYAKLVNAAAGQDVVPLPEVEQLWSATEVGAKFKVSANAIGKLANAHGLKVDQYGQFAMDKSQHSAKQMPSFRYNAAGVARIGELLGADAESQSPQAQLKLSGGSR